MEFDLFMEKIPLPEVFLGNVPPYLFTSISRRMSRQESVFFMLADDGYPKAPFVSG